MSDKIATQDIDLVGRVTYAKLGEEKKTTNGKVYQEFTVRLKLTTGIEVFTKTMLWNVNNPKPFTIQKKREYMEIIKRLNDDINTYAQCRIKKSKDGTMFDIMNMYEKNDGGLGMNIKGSISMLEDNVGINGEVSLTFGSLDGGYVKRYKDCKPKIVFYMIVLEKEDNMLCLTDGKEDYPNKIYGELKLLPKEVNGAKIGQGYKFIAEIKKGAQVSSSVESIWEDEATTTTYADNYLEIRPAGIVSGLTATIKDSIKEIKDNEQKKHGSLDDLPF